MPPGADAVNNGVVIFNGELVLVLIEPDGVEAVTDTVPITVPEPVIAPVPVAVIVSAVPDTDAPKAIGAFVPVSTNPSVPVAVIVFVVVCHDISVLPVHRMPLLHLLLHH